MEREPGAADERWQQLIEAFDPERNLRAISELWQQAASGSEHVLGSIMNVNGATNGFNSNGSHIADSNGAGSNGAGSNGTGSNGTGSNESGTFEPVASAFGAFGPDENGAFPGASLLRDAFAEMERSFGRLYGAMGSMMAEGPLRSAAFAEATKAVEIVVIDGVGTTSVTIPSAPAAPRCGELMGHAGHSIGAQSIRVLSSSSFDTAEPTFVVRVDVDLDTAPGAYHGQLLVQGLPEFTLPIVVRVVDAPETE